MRLRPTPTSATSPPRARRPLLPVLAGGALIAVVLSGCMKVDMALDLNSNDTVDGTLTLAMTQEVAELSGTDIDQFVEDARQELLSDEDAPKDATVEPYDDGQFIGTTMTFADAPLSTFTDDAGGDGLSIVRDGDEFVVTGTLDLTELDSETMAMLSGPDPEATIALTFPGKVAEHNGTLAGTTVTWTAAPGEVTELSARGSATESSSTLLLTLGIVGIALLAAAGVALWVRGRRSGPGGATPAGPYGYAPKPQGGPQTWSGSPAPHSPQSWAPAPPPVVQHGVSTGYGPTSTTPQTPPNYGPPPPAPPAAPPAPGTGGYGPAPSGSAPPPPPPTW